MPHFTRGATRIHYTLSGDPAGPPLLLLAPGGMKSAVEVWARVPWNPLERLKDFRLIGMDQRNAGESWGPIQAGDGWATYAADQLALLDHLGVEHFSALGMCIGGPFVMGLAQAAPERLRAGVLLQPIGLKDNRSDFYAMFNTWSVGVAEEHPEASPESFAALCEALFGGEFLFNTTPEAAAACTIPMLLLMGDDLYHPQAISRQLAGLLPQVTFVEQWKSPELLDATEARVRAFLQQHAAR